MKSDSGPGFRAGPYIGIMEKEMETTITVVYRSNDWGYIQVYILLDRRRRCTLLLGEPEFAPGSDTIWL